LPNGASTLFFLSGQSYYNVLWTAPNGNAYYILAHQYIATELNFLNGAYPPAAQSAFNQATVLFNTYTPAQIAVMKSNNPVRQQFLSLASVLDDYNNGIIGPGHCEDEGEKSASATVVPAKSVTGINVYPNPVLNQGIIEFTAEEDARTTVELYSLVGQRMGLLYDNGVTAGNTYQVTFDARSYQPGLYIVVVKSGNSTQKEKISISR
jgi:hypothetical protein